MAQSFPTPQGSVPLTSPTIVTTQEERTWASIAHLSVLLNLVSGFVGIIAALIIYLVYKDRSRFVAYHALQSLVMQLLLWFLGGIFVAAMWAVVGILSAVIIGICLIPVAILFSFIPVVPLVYGIVAAIQVNQGSDFKYYLIGDWVRGTYEGTSAL